MVSCAAFSHAGSTHSDSQGGTGHAAAARPAASAEPDTSAWPDHRTNKAAAQAAPVHRNASISDTDQIKIFTPELS
jgi:hypothetical protein